MRVRIVTLTTAAALACLSGAPVCALDRYEPSNDSPNTTHQLTQGVRDELDLQGTNDQDLMTIRPLPGHSYEVRSYSHAVDVNMGPLGLVNATLERTNDAGGILQTADFPGGAIGYASLRWISDGANGFIQVRSSTTQTAASLYDVDFTDTTYLVPRWNNAGAQVTVFVVQNGSRAAVTGNVDFYNAAGTLLFTQPLSIPVNGVQVFNTASAPALVGASGSARITNDAPWGTLAGKAVAVEASTGFTFDTPITPIPR